MDSKSSPLDQLGCVLHSLQFKAHEALQAVQLAQQRAGATVLRIITQAVGASRTPQQTHLAQTLLPLASITAGGLPLRPRDVHPDPPHGRLRLRVHNWLADLAGAGQSSQAEAYGEAPNEAAQSEFRHLVSQVSCQFRSVLRSSRATSRNIADRGTSS